ncbi:unnamed protein product [Brachionus calyciflorus]|uniref:Uncharacterized protein n=1 Tax=Brachionus calyciflorus TaxID=104777 RepID=A0A813WPI7_9BILA|nr:unnamed protein product [Brachionus calyciflorus]
MKNFKIEITLVVLCILSVQCLAENNLSGNHEQDKLENNINDDLSGTQELNKRYRLHGKRSNDVENFDPSEDDDDDTLHSNEISKRYRLYPKKSNLQESDWEKRYRLYGKRYRLYGKRYRLYGKRDDDSDVQNASNDESIENNLMKRYRLIGKRYRLMG